MIKLKWISDRPYHVLSASSVYVSRMWEGEGGTWGRTELDTSTLSLNGRFNFEPESGHFSYRILDVGSEVRPVWFSCKPN